MLKDIQSIERTLLTLLPKKQRKPILRLLRDVDDALGNYISGQFLVCVVVGVLAYIGYLIVGLPYALLMAALVAVFNVIPYLGPIFGLIQPLFVALTVSPKTAVGVVIVNLFVQMLEGNVISRQTVWAKPAYASVVYYLGLIGRWGNRGGFGIAFGCSRFCDGKSDGGAYFATFY